LKANEFPENWGRFVMIDRAMGQSLDPDTLMSIIKVQSEIASLGYDLSAVMEFVTEQAQAMTRAGGAVLELAEGDQMVYRAVAGMASNQLGLRLARETSMSGMSVASGEVLTCADSETDNRVDREACRKVGLRSMVVVPLVHRGAPVGVLKVMSEQVDAFARRDATVLGLMAELIAASVSQSARLENNDLYHRATHDALTGLANRALFYDRLRQGVALGRRRESKLGVLILDLDGLKPINDACGHRAGDAAIRETATRIKQVSRQSDTAARLGGDEFGVILNDVQARDCTERHANRLAEVIEQPFRFEGQELPLGVSIGAAVFPEDGDCVESLVENADRLMYQSKRERKGEA
jgi:diguanylate cyclase (GGDEF)-like protein